MAHSLNLCNNRTKAARGFSSFCKRKFPSQVKKTTLVYNICVSLRVQVTYCCNWYDCWKVLFMVLTFLYLVFCFAVLCAKNLAKKDFFSKYAPIV